jgi:hypothetical protein
MKRQRMAAIITALFFLFLIPGLLYLDALALDLPDFRGRFRSDRFLSEMALGKVIGLGITGKIPDSTLYSRS